jgi:hypothetical protein
MKKIVHYYKLRGWMTPPQENRSKTAVKAGIDFYKRKSIKHDFPDNFMYYLRYCLIDLL